MLEGIDVGPTVTPVLPALVILVLCALFYFDGMVIGKFLPPAAFFVSYVALFQPSPAVLLWVSLSCVVAATLGQWTLYRGLNDESPEFFGVRRRVPYVDRIPLIVRGGLGERRLRIVTSLFDRLGGVALPIANVIPGVRSLLTIPAGLSRYPVGRFLAFSFLGNAAYVALLAGISLGIVEVSGLVPIVGRSSLT